jgi:hypothetical protein
MYYILETNIHDTSFIYGGHVETHCCGKHWSELVLRSDKENLRQVIDSENERKIREESRRERERKRFCEGGRKSLGKEKGLSISCWKTELYRKYWFIIDNVR